MVITATRKAALITEFGDSSGCITSDSWLKAVVEDLDGKFSLYTDDFDFLTKNIGYCSSTPGATGTPGTTTPGAGVLQKTTTPPIYPASWKIGKTEWCGQEFTNIGTGSWKGYLGVKITDSKGAVWEYPGDPTYTYVVATGVTRTLWAHVPTPAGMAEGTASVEIVLNQV
jgi:hypothetical protein